MEDLGIIEVHRKKGIEKRRITQGRFSIDKFRGKLRANIWVFSVDAIIEGPEDIGNSEVVLEVKFPLDHMPNFKTKWVYIYPSHEQIPESNFGETIEEFFDNYYYYEHESLKQMDISIHEINDKYFVIGINGIGLDPWNSEDTKYSVKFKTSISTVLKGYWVK